VTSWTTLYQAPLSIPNTSLQTPLACIFAATSNSRLKCSCSRRISHKLWWFTPCRWPRFESHVTGWRSVSVTNSELVCTTSISCYHSGYAFETQWNVLIPFHQLHGVCSMTPYSYTAFAGLRISDVFHCITEILSFLSQYRDAYIILLAVRVYDFNKLLCSLSSSLTSVIPAVNSWQIFQPCRCKNANNV